MDGMTESVPTLSSACCAGPGPYRPIGKFRVIGRILNRKFNVPSKPDTARPTQLTSTGRGCSHQPGHPSQEFHISRAGASRTRALTTGSPALYQLSYGTGSIHSHIQYRSSHIQYRCRPSIQAYFKAWIFRSYNTRGIQQPRRHQGCKKGLIHS